MRIPIVNEQDELIGYKERTDRNPKDIFRITALYVFNSQGDFLIAKRHYSKNIDPNKWGPSVAGTVEENEDYDSNVVKEAEEEIGLKNIFIKPFRKYFYGTWNARRFCYVYTTIVDISESDFLLQEDEVSEVRWVSVKELKEWFERNPDDFVPSFQNTLNRIDEFQNENQN